MEGERGEGGGRGREERGGRREGGVVEGERGGRGEKVRCGEG